MMNYCVAEYSAGRSRALQQRELQRKFWVEDLRSSQEDSESAMEASPSTIFLCGHERTPAESPVKYLEAIDLSR